MNDKEKEVLKNKKSYILYFDKMEMIYELSDEEAGKLIKAINSARSNELRDTDYEIPDFGDNRLLKIIYKQISNTWEQDDQSWARRVINLRQFKDSRNTATKEESPEYTEPEPVWSSEINNNLRECIPQKAYMPIPPQDEDEDEDDLVPFPEIDD